MAWIKRFHKPGDPEEGYYFDVGTFVCRGHFKDNFLNNYIKRNGDRGTCSYCKRRRRVIELEAVLELIAIGLDYIYEDPANTRYLNKETTYGYDGDVQPFDEIWRDDSFDLRIEDEKLYEDVKDQLQKDELYCKRDEFGSHEDYLHDLWSHFKEVLRHKARFVFHFPNTFSQWNLSEPVKILDQVQFTIIKQNMIKELPIGTNLYRARQHKIVNEVDGAPKIASLPNHLNKAAGRMNAAGISLFYCSNYKDLTVKEVVSKKRGSYPYYTTAIFKNNNKLKLVDLTKLPAIPSVFDTENHHYRDIIFFMKSFIEEISLPVLKKDSVLDYLPTQVVTEYIRYNPTLEVDGMIYKSAKDSSKENIVLFYDHKESLEKLSFVERSVKTRKVNTIKA